MSLFHKSLNRIVESDLRELITDLIHESRTLEFKAEEPNFKADRSRDNIRSPKIETLIDLCSFANAEGGDVIYGMEAKSGIATKLSGVSIENEDAFSLRLHQIVNVGIKPQIRIEPKFITLTNSTKKALIVRIHPSWNPPHAVWDDFAHYYSRNSNGKYALDVESLRHLFIGSEAITDRINSFRFKRIDEILAGRTPRATYGTSSVRLTKDTRTFALAVLHILPLISFSQRTMIDLTRISRGSEIWNEVASQFFGCTRGDYHFAKSHFSLDGLAMPFGGLGTSDRPDFGYIKIFHNGAIEICFATYAYNRDSDSDPKAQLALGKFSTELNCLFDIALKLCDKFSISPPPYSIGLSLLNCNNLSLWGPGRFGNMEPTPPFDRDHIIIPEETFQEIPADSIECLIPIYKRLWQSVGISEPPPDWV